MPLLFAAKEQSEGPRARRPSYPDLWITCDYGNFAPVAAELR
jgi:hypothetical protein